MEISTKGIDLIVKYEGLKLHSYKCPAGIYTIGIGTTTINGKPVGPNMNCTKEDAYNWLKEHLTYSVYPVLEYIKIPLTQNQFDALCSLIYNIGSQNFKKSSILKELNCGRFDNAAMHFLDWNKARVNGKLTVLKGLTLRRNSEKLLFESLGE